MREAHNSKFKIQNSKLRQLAHNSKFKIQNSKLRQLAQQFKNQNSKFKNHER